MSEPTPPFPQRPLPRPPYSQAPFQSPPYTRAPFPPTPGAPLQPERGVYRPGKFKQETTVRDYAIYALLILVLGGIAGGVAYYFTRPEPEQQKLADRLKQTRRSILPHPKENSAEVKLAETSSSKLVNGIIDGKDVAEPSPAPIPPPPASSPSASAPAAVKTTAYGGSFALSVLDPVDPKAPRPSTACLSFGQSLRLSAILAGRPGRATLNGKTYRVGDAVSLQLGITLVSIDTDQRLLVLREASTGADLRIGY